MTRSFIPAITTGPRPTPSIIVYGAKPAARAFSSRRSKMYFFHFCCLFPATFRQSASFGSTNIDAYYLILAWKAHEEGRTACYNRTLENGRLLKLEKGSFATLGRFGDLAHVCHGTGGHRC